MNTKQLKAVFCALVTLGAAALVPGSAPTREPLAGTAFNPRERLTLEKAAKYAQAVVLLKRVIKDNQIHSYVKEVWRSRADETPPAVGSEYGRTAPYDPQMRYPERDAILFEFGAGRSKGLEHNWQIPVDEKRRVPAFLEEVPVVDNDGTLRRMAQEPMHVDDVRSAVKNTKPEE